MISNSVLKIKQIRELINSGNLKYNVDNKIFDTNKHNQPKLIFGIIMGIKLPWIYCIESDGIKTIIANNWIINLLLNHNIQFDDDFVKIAALEKIDNIQLLFNIAIIPEMKQKYIDDFNEHAECFNLDDFYLTEIEIQS